MAIRFLRTGNPGKLSQYKIKMIKFRKIVLKTKICVCYLNKRWKEKSIYTGWAHIQSHNTYCIHVPIIKIIIPSYESIKTQVLWCSNMSWTVGRLTYVFMYIKKIMLKKKETSDATIYQIPSKMQFFHYI